ncbi:MAG: cryptochrome/photolyase family protein [Pseudomonadota bacterium]
MAGTLRFVLGDQLDTEISSLKGADADADIVFMCEVAEEANYVRHHKQKIAFLFSAMRHYAESLRDGGFSVRYVKLDDPDNTGSFADELARAVAEVQPERIAVTEPGEWRVLEDMRSWEGRFGIPVEILDDDRFYCTRQRFADWAEGRKGLRMEYFYREMRRENNILMDGDQPVGGQWNYDKENREPIDPNVEVPDHHVFRPDDVTQEVIELVKSRFDNHFGNLNKFEWPVTRAEALQALGFFVEERLNGYGTYQDAMVQGEPFLFHSLLSPMINCGLLRPREVVDAALAAYERGKAPLNAVEGFVRQIIGWREYVRGIYWLKMPDYKDTNELSATRPLPDFYWTGETQMNCLRQAITETKENAYAHHIQRLMVTGNFALIAGLSPAEVEEWYLIVYADAYEWVELPNVHGMILYADGGYLASKPYASSGAYINKMSNYCGNCSYSVTKKNGPKACPFNYLYWNFLIENEDALRGNHRMGMMYGTLGRMKPGKIDAIKEDSRRFLESL